MNMSSAAEDIRSNILTLDQVAEQLQGSVAEVGELVKSGELKAFPFGGGFRTTQAAIDDLVERLMARATNGAFALTGPQTQQTPVTSLLAPLPTISQIKSVTWKQVAPVTYTSRNGTAIDWQETAFGHTFDIGGKPAPLVIAVFGPQGRQYKGVTSPYWGAEVYWGEVGHGLQAINEWVKVSDYGKTHEIASVIKKDKRFVKPGETLSQEYNQLKVSEYHKVITRPNTKVSQCVVAHETDRASIALHALLRCRDKGLI